MPSSPLMMLNTPIAMHHDTQNGTSELMLEA